MTRSVQKTDERAILDLIMVALGERSDREPEPGETPDFLVTIRGRRIGVEITAYDSGEVIEGRHGRRQVESEWDKFKLASDAFRAAEPDLKDVNAILYFSGSVPPHREHTDFLNEIAAFIRAHRQELTNKDTDYDPRHFSTPLMRAHLQVLYLRTCPYAEWKANLDAGFVATATTSLIPDIVARKSTKQFRPTDELWIAIHCTTKISGTLLPVDLSDFETLSAPLAACQFGRVFVLTYLGSFQWKRGDGWRQLNGSS
jgi:hypothetical protein